MRPILAAFALILALARPAGAETETGPAYAKDGDSLIVAGIEVRLARIDAPEFDQSCSRAGQPYQCGTEATAYIRSLIAGQIVTCEGVVQDDGTVRDQYGRFLGRCWANGVHLNAAMVEAGWALAFRRFSDEYVPQEDAAREARRGIWVGEFQTPWDFRRAKAAKRAAR